MKPKLGTHNKLVVAFFGLAFIVGIRVVDSGVDAGTALETGIALAALLGLERVPNKPKIEA